MKRHFESKKPCQNKTGILLTDEIREHVLTYHTYKVEKKNPKHVINQFNQTVNNYNTLNAFITQMPFPNKINLLMDYQNKKMIDFEDDLEKTFSGQVDRLENNSYPNGYYLDLQGILNLVDIVTKVKKDHLERFNILFDKTVKRLKYFSCGDWDTFLEDIGAKEVIKLLKSYFLDTYEVYLIKNLHGDETFLNRVTVKDHLDIYYQFIAALELDPIVINQTDEEILGHRLIEAEEYHLSNKYSSQFHKLKTSVKPIEKNRIKKRISSIIKENTVHNIGELNHVLLDLLNIDDKFAQMILSQAKQSSPAMLLGGPSDSV
jgi:hypothetical protein